MALPLPGESGPWDHGPRIMGRPFETVKQLFFSRRLAKLRNSLHCKGLKAQILIMVKTETGRSRVLREWRDKEISQGKKCRR